MSGTQRPTLREGDTGADVESVQRTLGLPVDGDYGPVTTAGVTGFQAAMGLPQDGAVGQTTWARLDNLDMTMEAGSNGLSAEISEAIIGITAGSPAASYQWRDRGRAPEGYTEGMALTYGLCLQGLLARTPLAIELSKPLGNSDVDALAWYREQFAAANMDLGSEEGRLQSLFVLLTGLGMRESSGLYYEGRDTTATNTTSDTAEAGLFQTSWNIESCSPLMGDLFTTYWNDPNGWLPVFCKNLYPTKSGLQNFGTGDGASYQWLAKYSPAFAVMTTALGLRKRRQHWGPVNRFDVELSPAVNDLFSEVSELIKGGEEPDVVVPSVIVDINTTAGVSVVVNVNGKQIS